eukprot:snap_masked-scaffold_1-processed-gene-31.8-mRNA-1 protein AED:1.00 eAED:1.00 QI:0/-1/0/0/-1/1/1/0/355
MKRKFVDKHNLTAKNRIADENEEKMTNEIKENTKLQINNIYRKRTRYKLNKLKRPFPNSNIEAFVRAIEVELCSEYAPSYSRLNATLVRMLKLSGKTVDHILKESLTTFYMLFLGSSKSIQKYFQDDLEGSKEISSSQKITEVFYESLSQQGNASGSVTESAKSKVDKNIINLELSNSVTMNSRNVYISTNLQKREGTESSYVISNEEIRTFVPDLMGFSSSAESRLRRTGSWGEKLVYSYLKKKHEISEASAKAIWVNEIKESLHPYDIRIIYGSENNLSQTHFIEVKSTVSPDKNVFEFSKEELDFMSSRGGKIKYSIYRVFNSGNLEKVWIRVLDNPMDMLNSRRINLCLAI